MKNHLLILIALSSLVLIPFNVLATSGACSYHSGVNCSAGPDYNGKVQCNDGWINSSVYFSDTDECKISCIPPLKTSCGTEADYAALNTLLLKSGSLQGTQSGQAVLDACRTSIIQYQAQLQSYNICLSNSNSSPVQSSCPANSYTSGNQCICITGYKADPTKTFCIVAPTPTPLTCDIGFLVRNGQCISYTQDCMNSFGPNMVGITGPNNNSTCSCNLGYQWNTSKTACTLIPTIAPNIVPKLLCQSKLHPQLIVQLNLLSHILLMGHQYLHQLQLVAQFPYPNNLIDDRGIK
jgi:hypothetical protein